MRSTLPRWVVWELHVELKNVLSAFESAMGLAGPGTHDPAKDQVKSPAVHPLESKARSLKFRPIEDYALIGNGRTAALVSRDGSIDWLCLPSFDSGACFAALLGNEENGYWSFQPTEQFKSERTYFDSTMILETTFTTASGRVKLTDWMSVVCDVPRLLRKLECLEGEVEMRMEYVVRFDYGSIIPWVSKGVDGLLSAVAGPDTLQLQTSFDVHGENMKSVAQFRMQTGEKQSCALTWISVCEDPENKKFDCQKNLEICKKWWEDWIAQCTYKGEHRELVVRSLLTLKSLIYTPTGGIVAAPTTSLPETLGGERNWDYRYTWVRDSTFTLHCLLSTGFESEAEAWRKWLLRAVAGTPSQFSIMYGIRGERRLTETQLDWLRGYENSSPVRIGNAAFEQRQLDIFGELMDTLHMARTTGLGAADEAWGLQCNIMDYLETIWREPDEGIWEVRGGRRNFVHSKVMAWVAFDRAIRAIEEFGHEGPLEKWREIRSEIHASVIENGYNSKINSFTQYYGSENVDASLLMLASSGFLPIDDPRIRGTIDRVEKELLQDGFVLRYQMKETKDGLTGDEGAFLACSFWLVDAYVLMGEREKAQALFAKLARLVNEVGLLSEEYNTKLKRQVGNFPQALSHLALVNSALNLARID